MKGHTANAVERWPREREGWCGAGKEKKERKPKRNLPKHRDDPRSPNNSNLGARSPTTHKTNQNCIGLGNQYIKEHLEPGAGVCLPTWLLMIFTWVSQTSDIRLSRRWGWVPPTTFRSLPGGSALWSWCTSWIQVSSSRIGPGEEEAEMVPARWHRVGASGLFLRSWWGHLGRVSAGEWQNQTCMAEHSGALFGMDGRWLGEEKRIPLRKQSECSR